MYTRKVSGMLDPETLEHNGLLHIADFPSTEYGRILTDVIKAEIERLRLENRRAPKLCDSDILEDIRYKLGGIHRLEWILSLPAEADRLISKGKS